jgi:hypothetical protein
MEDAPYFELDLLLSVASGLGRSELSASGRRVYIKDDDCLGEIRERACRERWTRWTSSAAAAAAWRRAHTHKQKH